MESGNFRDGGECRNDPPDELEGPGMGHKRKD